jgi:hypothetical protein
MPALQGPPTPAAGAPAAAADAPGGGGGGGGGGLAQRVAALAVEVHASVQAAAERFHRELRRRWGNEAEVGAPVFWHAQLPCLAAASPCASPALPALPPCCPPRFYVTPKNYLNFLARYASLTEAQGSELCAARERLLSGIARLKVGGGAGTWGEAGRMGGMSAQPPACAPGDRPSRGARPHHSTRCVRAGDQRRGGQDAAAAQRARAAAGGEEGSR